MSEMTREEALSHFGVKGMKWGVRKEDSPVGSKSNKKDIAKKVAIGAGILAVAAGTTYVGYKLHQSGSLQLRNVKKSTTSDLGKKTAEKVLKEPTDIIHLARGKNKGLTFLKKGETEDYFQVFDKLGGNKDGPSFFQKATDGSGKIIARFADPEGRKDFAGRPILHDVVIPKSMSDGISSLQDVENKIWPVIKDGYDAFYKSSETLR